MRTFVRSIASIVMPLSVVGCDDFLGIGGDTIDVEVIAEVRQLDNFIGYTIENRSSDTIFFDHSPRASNFERREGGGWRLLIPDYPVIDILVIASIGPGETFSADSQIDTGHARLAPGEYRYNLPLYEDSSLERPLPEDVRTSNIIRIE